MIMYNTLTTIGPRESASTRRLKELKAKYSLLVYNDDVADCYLACIEGEP